jgi:hypothetical protein
MFGTFLGFIAPIAEDAPTKLEKYIHGANQYVDRFFGFAGHMIADHPNEFITALATATIAWFTYTLSKSTRRLWNLARQEFISTHRPKLVVRELLMLEPENDERTIAVQYVIANIGEGNARIVESWVEVKFSRDRRLWPIQRAEGANLIGNTLLRPGTHVFREQGSSVSLLSLATGRQIFQAGHHPVQIVFFRGFIIYLDDNLVRRKTAFCRIWNWESRRFDRVDDPDYEYVD